MKLKNLILIALLFGVTVGCKKSEDAPAPSMDLFKPEVVKGPSLEGTWKSNCRQGTNTGEWEVIEMQVTEKRTLTRRLDVFSDIYCQSLKETWMEMGSFYYSKDLLDGMFEVVYLYSNEGGEVINKTENIKFDGQNLWVSNYASGETLPHIQLFRVVEQDEKDNEDDLTEIPDHKPEFGHYAKYVGTNSTEEYSNQGTDGEVWTIYHNIEKNGRISQGYRYYESLWSTVKYHKMMESCETDGGTIEIIEVKAGRFKTCKQLSDRTLFWKGNIPIWGVVKAQNIDTAEISELVDFYF